MSLLRRFLGSGGNALLLVFLIILAIIVEPALISPRAIKNILTSANPLIVVAVGQALVMLTGGVDLSVGSVISLSNVIAALLMQRSPGLAIPIMIFCVLAGMAVGLLNGLLVAYARVSAFIITLAVGIALQGVTLDIMKQPGGEVTQGLAQISRITWGRVPVVTIVLVVLVLLLAWAIRRTPLGISLIAVGGNEASARMSGLPVLRLKALVYVISGGLASCAGLLLASRVSSGDPLIGTPYSLDSITAAVLGGTSLVGGVISGVGALVAGVLLTLINTLLNLRGMSPFLQWIVKGAILIAALSLDFLRRRARRT
ncbi:MULTISPECIES: ABC transporter permease [unclassified Acidisoma]|jgi:ribose transport system permease protein|uniref:ABC transporter permease n=1 Tax=unclassified Acidisoma TaxID=2634065 RepID=UPI00131E02B3|nr:MULTISPECIES: ABC transporter permease [unclassified Acidisoma]